MCGERVRAALGALGILACAALASAASDPPEPGMSAIVAPGQPLTAGEKAGLRFVSNVPGLRRLDWAILQGPGFVLPNGEYHAPYTVSAPETTVTVGAFALGDSGRVRAVTVLRLLPGQMPGAAECRGPEQERLPEYDETQAPDELPVLVSRADAVVPRRGKQAARADTVLIHALVCQNGRVVDAYLPPAAFEFQGRLVMPDSARVRAAFDAAARYVFRPAKARGKPVATWMTLLVPLKTK